MKIHYILSLAFALLPSLAAAQHITFESTDEYQSLGVYDTWEQSPFRTGVLDGTPLVTLTDNPDKEEKDTPGVATNASNQVLAVQRSRFGSNTFGARINLNEPFCLGTSKKYVHVLVNKPMGEGGVVMLIGLGKRHDWEGQKPETEQFWVTASLTTQGQWNDLVFPITTNESVDIHSFVVVPDLASPHLRTSDFVAYIDDIEVSDSPKPRFQIINYPLNFDTDQASTRSNERQLTKLTFSSTGENPKDVAVPISTVYNNLTEKATVLAKAGGEVSVTMTYKGGWMSGYVYVDWNNDGQFTPVIENNQPAEGSELVSYSYLGGYNSKGDPQANGNSVVNGAITCPSFIVPAGIQPGVYRMRLKVDWDCSDAGGNDATGNLITANGGAVVDVLLNVHEDNVRISANQLNGDVLAANGDALSEAPIPFGQAVKIKMDPAPDFTYTGVVITHGYNLDGPEYVRDNRQYQRINIPASSFNKVTKEYTIPASYIDGEVRIEGLFTPGTDPAAGEETTSAYTVVFKNGDGTFYNSGGSVVSGGWNAAKWVSSDLDPIVTIVASGNNGLHSGNYVMASDRTITLSVSELYVITGYKISTASGWGAKVTAAAGEYQQFTGAQTLEVTLEKPASSTFFTIAAGDGLNNPVIEIYINDAGQEEGPNIPVGISMGEQAFPQKNVTVYDLSGRRVSMASAASARHPKVYVVNNKKVAFHK